MSELVFLKLGGSIVTDKRRSETPRPAFIARAAEEVGIALHARSDLRLVIGHGSGSFGHFPADKYKVREGHLRDWRGYAETGAAAQRLNRLIVDAFLSQGVRVVSLQPSASALCRDGEIARMAVEPITELLEHGVVPVVYGDVALDEVRGCTIVSTEQILVHLARRLRPQRIILVGEVAGVYTGDPQRGTLVRLIPEITPVSFSEIEHSLSASHGVDVTGGMLSKVKTLLALVAEQPELRVRIITGRRNRLITEVLLDEGLSEGTLLRP